MNKLLILTTAIFIGCQQTKAQPTENMQGKIPVYAAYSLLTSGGNAPDVKPVNPDGKCPDCNGLGKVGDGVIMLECKACDGTGKLKTEKPKPKPQPPKVNTPPVKEAKTTTKQVWVS